MPQQGQKKQLHLRVSADGMIADCIVFANGIT
jgi:hypothetical protein